jgi:hypothetical protein
MLSAVEDRAMPGITEADMNRINEFIKQTKFERDPDQLCPGDEEPESDGDVANAATN